MELQHMETKTIETLPPSAKAAISTPSEIDYLAVVRTNAKRKVDNGAQFSSTKGKTSLLLCVLDAVRSLLKLQKHDDNGNPIPLPDDTFQKCKLAVSQFWQNDARDLINRAIEKDAKITVRHGVLMTRLGGKGEVNRSKTDKITSVYAPEKHEHKLCDMFGLTSAKARLDVILNNIGKHTREELSAQRSLVARLEELVNSHK